MGGGITIPIFTCLHLPSLLIEFHESYFLPFVVSKFAKERIQPHVTQMDIDGRPNLDVVKELFQNGVTNWLCKLFANSASPTY